MAPEAPNAKKKEEQGPLPNRAVEEFFVKVNHDFRRPKPSEPEVAAAIEAIENFTKQAAFEEKVWQAAEPVSGSACSKCGAANSSLNRFCGYCGALLAGSATPLTKTEAQPPSGRDHHFHHHHYHHFPEAGQKTPRRESSLWTSEVQPGQVDAGLTTDEAIQKLVENWSLYLNSKRLDDLVGLYSLDAIVLRPRAAYAHGSSAIRQLFKTVLDSAVGQVELECGDVGIVGDIACLTGYARVVLPAAAKRLEESGKYLLVLRREAAGWKIVADSWCMDGVRNQPSAPAQAPAVVPMRASKK